MQIFITKCQLLRCLTFLNWEFIESNSRVDSPWVTPAQLWPFEKHIHSIFGDINNSRANQDWLSRNVTYQKTDLRSPIGWATMWRLDVKKRTAETLRHSSRVSYASSQDTRLLLAGCYISSFNILWPELPPRCCSRTIQFGLDVAWDSGEVRSRQTYRSWHRASVVPLRVNNHQGSSCSRGSGLLRK